MTSPLRHWPNLFLPGAAKAGTTSVAQYLTQHPSISMCRPKEPHFFASSPIPRRLRQLIDVVTDEEQYRALFATLPATAYVGEASTSYLQDPLSPHKIHSVSPEARVIIMLRDPVDRAISHYFNDVSEGVEHRSISDAVIADTSLPIGHVGEYSAYARDGLYAEAIMRYKETFGDQMIVCIFDDLISAPVKVLSNLFEFLGVATEPARMIRYERHNTYSPPRNVLAAKLLAWHGIRQAARRTTPAFLRHAARSALMRPSTRPVTPTSVVASLEAFYREDIERTERLLGRTLPWHSGRKQRSLG